MPERRAATPKASLFLTLLQTAERPILGGVDGGRAAPLEGVEQGGGQELVPEPNQVLERRAARLRRHDFREPPPTRDRKSTRLNSSHSQISYAVFCLKKKKT